MVLPGFPPRGALEGFNADFSVSGHLDWSFGIKALGVWVGVEGSGLVAMYQMGERRCGLLGLAGAQKS